VPIAVTGYSHVRLTVTDLARSRRFYDDVFGFPVAYELPPDADEQTRAGLWFLFGGVIYALPDGQLLALRPVAPVGDAFDCDRVGLDHLSLGVADVDAAVAVLDELGVPHGPVKELGVARMVELCDPDGIALELWESA
jgi:glyoxylase I family protein